MVYTCIEWVIHLGKMLPEWSRIQILLSAVWIAMEHFHWSDLILQKRTSVLFAHSASTKPNIIRRWLCSEPPQNGKRLHSRKFPKNFSVKVPKVKEDGTLERDSTLPTTITKKATMRTSPFCRQCQMAPRRVQQRATNKERALEALLHSSIT